VRSCAMKPTPFTIISSKMLMAHDDGTLNAARVRIDGSGGREFQRSLNSYLRRELGVKIKDVNQRTATASPTASGGESRGSRGTRSAWESVTS
jgi:hypothetical protein